jgi:hypothetical protein
MKSKNKKKCIHTLTHVMLFGFSHEAGADLMLGRGKPLLPYASYETLLFF